jgi:hypothetical protein
MNPVDPWSPLDCVDWTGRAEDHHRHAIAPGVKDRHGRMHQPHIRMHGSRHGLTGDLGIAVGDRHRAFLMQAKQHLRAFIAEIVDEAVVQAAIARARIEGDVGDICCAQCVGDHVAAETGGIDPRRNRTIER